jgi:hypothetical protein
MLQFEPDTLVSLPLDWIMIIDSFRKSLLPCVRIRNYTSDLQYGDGIEKEF